MVDITAHFTEILSDPPTLYRSRSLCVSRNKVREDHFLFPAGLIIVKIFHSFADTRDFSLGPIDQPGCDIGLGERQGEPGQHRRATVKVQAHFFHLFFQLLREIILGPNMTKDTGPSADMMNIDDPIFRLHPVEKSSSLVRG